MYVNASDSDEHYASSLPQNAPTSLKETLEQLLDAVVSYTEPNGRLVSELFQKLPSKMVCACSPMTSDIVHPA